MRRIALMLLVSLSAIAQPRGWPPIPEQAMQLLTHGNTDAFVASLRQTAEAGDRVSMFWLGRSLEDVKGVPHDYAQAQQWYRMAADKGLGVAAWSLGRLFELGRGTAPDFDEAQKWYRKADELGFRRTALTMIQIRWVPGSQELEYQPVPQELRNPQAQAPPGLGPVGPDLNSAELEIFAQIGYARPARRAREYSRKIRDSRAPHSDCTKTSERGGPATAPSRWFPDLHSRK